MPDGVAYLFLAFFLLCAFAGIAEGVSVWIGRHNKLAGGERNAAFKKVNDERWVVGLFGFVLCAFVLTSGSAFAYGTIGSMSHKEIWQAWAPGLFGVGGGAIVARYSPATAWVMIGAAVLWTAVFCFVGLRRVFKIEDFAVHNALNLRITNKRVKRGLADSQLTLHSIKKWEPGRGQFCLVRIFAKMPIALTNDQPHLPYGVSRMFQLVEFIDKTRPGIRGVIDGVEALFPLPDHGIWEESMELRWAGGNLPIVRYFKWDSQSLPMFCKKPST